MGGFSGSVPEPTLARVKQPVATGQLRFFLLGGAGGFGGAGGRGGADGTTAQVTSWVESACAAVPARDYGAASGGTGTLYECGSPMVSTAARTLFSQFKGTCLISARFCHLD